MKVCRVCDWRRVWCKGLCQTCYAYRRRTGRDRPEILILAHGQRVLEGLADHSRVI